MRAPCSKLEQPKITVPISFSLSYIVWVSENNLKFTSRFLHCVYPRTHVYQCTMSDIAQICAVCKVPAMQLCAGCKSVYYCNRDHQKKHWKDGHKNNCASYKLTSSPAACGQHLIAARDLKQNEVILKEVPCIVAPHNLTYVTCLGCNRRIEDTPDTIYKCTNCNWPLCGEKCQNAQLHKDECKLFTQKEYKADFSCTPTEQVETYSVIAPLRFLLLKSTAKTKYNTLITLLSRTEKSVTDKERDKLRTSIVPFIKEVLKLDYSEEEIIQAASIFDTQSLEIIRNEGNVNVRGLYPTSSLLQHDCKPNTKYSIQGDNSQLVLIATVPIPKGEIISVSHSEILWGTLARRAYLKETKNIDCHCKRCSDKTELGTHLGAIFCARCKKPNEQCCPKILSTDPLNPTAVWKCESCDHTIRGRQMVWGNDAIKSEMNRLGKNPLNLEQFLVKYKETLHPHNYHALVAKYALSQIYGNAKGYHLSELTDGIIERKIDICHELLEAADELAPGYTTLRGSLLYDLQATMVVQAKQEFNNGKVTKQAVQETLTECMVILKEASEILSSEPEMKEFLQEKLKLLTKEFDF